MGAFASTIPPTQETFVNPSLLLLASLATFGMLSLGGDPAVASTTPVPVVAEAAPPAPQGGHASFDNRSLRGPHGFTYSGSHATLGGIASSGIIRFDGLGGVRADYTTSVGGVTFTGTFLGTYNVNPDGTGSIVVNLPWLNTNGHGNFVLVDRGEGTFFTSTDRGYSVTGSTRRM